MLDQDGRVWLTSRIRPSENTAFCQAGSDHPSAQRFPTERAGRHLAMWDPAAEEMTLIDTCYSTHHLRSASDRDPRSQRTVPGTQTRTLIRITNKKRTTRANTIVFHGMKQVPLHFAAQYIQYMEFRRSGRTHLKTPSVRHN